LAQPGHSKEMGKTGQNEGITGVPRMAGPSAQGALLSSNKPNSETRKRRPIEMISLAAAAPRPRQNRAAHPQVRRAQRDAGRTESNYTALDRKCSRGGSLCAGDRGCMFGGDRLQRAASSSRRGDRQFDDEAVAGHATFISRCPMGRDGGYLSVIGTMARDGGRNRNPKISKNVGLEVIMTEAARPGRQKFDSGA